MSTCSLYYVVIAYNLNEKFWWTFFVWYMVDKSLIECSILEILMMSLLLDLIVAYISYTMRRYNAEDIS